MLVDRYQIFENIESVQFKTKKKKKMTANKRLFQETSTKKSFRLKKSKKYYAHNFFSIIFFIFPLHFLVKTLTLLYLNLYFSFIVLQLLLKLLNILFSLLLHFLKIVISDFFLSSKSHIF
ncbi:hypothetical protein EDEG_01365 [Edhazardia aedis USNM 41457]|uniref:Transmembrane protein n=1 Tax=Edhazardia aedis (strain USNM 41457) TaxID=1003232 RepID=J9D9E5_EDHAE|nr:hypothetical protein EDEG_01365 [Edhazardia aedis USNM 41457]|eukprot:EJW04401.1 hypothetical protein EDEG_01365 [Edhazardia aedis USNM 41457]